MNNTFIILAAGSGSRYKSKIPKQFTQYKGKMMLEHSIYKAIDSKLFNRVILVIKKSQKTCFLQKKCIITRRRSVRFKIF